MIDRFSSFQRTPVDLREKIIFKNVSGESLPAYGVFRVDAFVSPYYEAKKPDGSVAMHFINGPVAVANNAFGEAPLWHYPAEVLTDDALFGKVIGPERDTWKMNQCSDGWIAINSPASGRVMVACMFSDRRVQCVATSLIGTAANSLTSPSTGTADLLAKKSDGNLYVVGSVTITNRFRTASIDNGKYFKAEWIGNELQPYAADC